MKTQENYGSCFSSTCIKIGMIKRGLARSPGKDDMQICEVFLFFFFNKKKKKAGKKNEVHVLIILIAVFC